MMMMMMMMMIWATIGLHTGLTEGISEVSGEEGLRGVSPPPKPLITDNILP